MNIVKELIELTEAKVITQDTANKIQNYYENKSSPSTNRLFIVFGILGALLIGLGTILIIAHNWDELPRVIKTVFAFMPLLTGQILCGFALIKKQSSIAWRESATTFLFFAVGASIALVGQIYNIPGNLSSYLLTWMLLCLPLIYVMKSSIASLLYLIGITYYACKTGYWGLTSPKSYLYWLLLVAVLPHYYTLYKKTPKSNFMSFHNWIIPLSIIICLITVRKNTEEVLFIAYFSLFGLLYLIGNLSFFTKQKTINNAFKLLGSLGTIMLLLALSFDWFWENLRAQNFQIKDVFRSPEFFASAITSVLAGWFFYSHIKKKTLSGIKPIAVVFLLFIVTFVIGLVSPIATVLINFYVFAIGVLTVKDGAKQNHLGKLNYGLLIITALVTCRFFDTEISFIIRGILFLLVGVGFFAANYWILKKRSTNE